MTTEKYKVLLVDDSPDDRFFIRTALERNPKFLIIREARDGQEAIDYLTGVNGMNDSASLPDILLLDLKMPRKTGFDVLQWLNTQSIDNLTIAVLSGSWLADDIAKSLSLGAHAYFKKTSLRKEQEKMIDDMEKLLCDRKKTVSN